MTGGYMIKRGISGLALLGVLAALVVGYAGIQAAPASAAAADQGTPTLINDVGQPDGGAGSQLPLGLGLLGLGVLGLVYGVTGTMRDRF
ncbi:MAG: hypothetical protein ACRDKY_03965 [Solirubrobacteraceae bacterium]